MGDIVGGVEAIRHGNVAEIGRRGSDDTGVGARGENVIAEGGKCEVAFTLDDVIDDGGKWLELRFVADLRSAGDEGDVGTNRLEQAGELK